MKKLFSSLLAATMVAGMSVSAFAGTATAGIKNEDYDFGLMGAYTDEGGKLVAKEKGTKIDGGDKLYFPILVSGEELIDQKDSAKDDASNPIDQNQMYFATKASEVKSLKASVKDEIGGKYIDSASIVKKDIKIDNAGEADEKETFTVDLSAVKADKQSGAVASPAKFEVTVDAKIDKHSSGTNSDKYDLVMTVGGNDVVAKDIAEDSDLTAVQIAQLFNGKTVDGYTITATAGSEVLKFEATVAGAKTAPTGSASFAVKDATNAPTLTAGSNTISNNVDGTDAGKDSVKPVELKVDGGSAVTFNVATADDNAAFLAAINGKEVNGYKVVDTTNPAKVKFEATTVGNKTPDPAKVVVSNTAQGAGDKVANKVQDGSGSGSSIGKVYCVEVKMSDYFKPEETEVEFNIKLKDGGKVAFDTDDDKLSKPAFFNGTFDLGRDTETLSAQTAKKKAVKGVEVKKFKKGDLEILIGKDTRSVQLDEAITSDGKKEDITNIYIENDKSIDNTFTFDVKASSQDDLYLELNQDADKDIATANPKADLIFFNFPGNPEFDFSGDATFAVEDEDADNYFYEIVKGELVETKAKYNEEDGVFELRTNKLGSYVISDKELETAKEDEDVKDTEDKGNEQAGGDASEDATPNNNGGKSNANTGAADLIGVASALAVVSVAAAGAVALKK